MSRRYALLILVAVCLTATTALAQTPDWWPDFDGKDDPGNGDGGDEKEPWSFDDPEWWPDFVPKEDIIIPP